MIAVKNNLSYSLMGTVFAEVVIDSINIRLKVQYRTSNVLYVREEYQLNFFKKNGSIF